MLLILNLCPRENWVQTVNFKIPDPEVKFSRGDFGIFHIAQAPGSLPVGAGLMGTELYVVITRHGESMPRTTTGPTTLGEQF